MRPPEGGQPGPSAEPLALGDAIAWLDRHVNLEAIERGTAGRAAAPTLERIAALCAALGDPQSAYPVVHVTGTNGKGSATRLCATLIGAQGLSVGAYTSPHLERLNERIAVNGEPIEDVDLEEQLVSLAALEDFLLARHELELPPTWFELVTAAAFRHFADVAVEAAVVEVGLGGRWDATNVADGLVAVVTNVELDHVEILGGTRTSIAAEKSGIVKAGATVCIGERDEELAGIFAERAASVGAGAVWRRGAEFDCVGNRPAVGGRVLDLRTPGASYEECYLPLFGVHQGENAAIALAAAEAFFGAPLDEEVVTAAFAASTVPGRLEVVGRRPLIVLDGAHNAAGAAALGVALGDDFAGLERVIAVVGLLRGRVPEEFLAAIGSERLDRVIACAPPSPRAQGGEDVAAAARALGIAAEVADGPEEALERALEIAGEEDLVLVTGSLYVVGAARGVARRLSSIRP